MFAKPNSRYLRVRVLSIFSCHGCVSMKWTLEIIPKNLRVEPTPINSNSRGVEKFVQIKECSNYRMKGKLLEGNKNQFELAKVRIKECRINGC